MNEKEVSSLTVTKHIFPRRAAKLKVIYQDKLTKGLPLNKVAQQQNQLRKKTTLQKSVEKLQQAATDDNYKVCE